MSEQQHPDARGALRAAEIAVAEGDLDQAEDACVAALSAIRRQQADRHGGGA